MRGVFRLMMISGLAASTYAGYRTVSGRRARRNPAGLPEANLAPEERRGALSRFGRRRRRRGDAATPRTEDMEAASGEPAAAAGEDEAATEDEAR